MATFILSQSAARELGWAQILADLSARTKTALGRRQALTLPFLQSRDDIQSSHERIAEVRQLLSRQLRLPLVSLDDLTQVIDRAAKQAVLLPAELLSCAALLRSAYQVRQFLRDHQAYAPLLSTLAMELIDETALAWNIENSIEPSGMVRDSASEELREYRERARTLHRRIKEKVEEQLHDPIFSEYLQDSYYSVRGDRYVVPIKSSFRSQVPGIIHNASQSGQTVFIEPDAIIPLGNELAIAQSLAFEEERRILADLSQLVGENQAALKRALEGLARIDVIDASAHLADALALNNPTLADASAAMRLCNVRHPLLLLQNKPVVANTIELDATHRGLVISGPNAGGKTVALTTVGLCTLMTWAGLPIAADASSIMPLYRGLSTTIGDAQDLSRDLSTFTAHLKRLKLILEVARAGQLVLIDEIAADTDPKEGAALARAILEHLATHGATVLVSTHLDEVKALPLVDERFINAHVGFHPDTLAPTYRLEFGSPGVSKAIDVAHQVGIPDVIIARARQTLGGEGLLSKALSKLEEQHASLARAERRLQEELANVAQEKAELARLRQAAETAERQIELRVRRTLMPELDALHAEAKSVITKLRAAPTIHKAQLAQQELQDKAAALEQSIKRLEVKDDVARHAGQPADVASKIVGGSFVRVVTLDQTGQVLELHGDEALVAVGAMRMRIKLADLVAVGKPSTKQTAKTPKQMASGAATINHLPLRHDVRGMRADEAQRTVERALEDAYGQNASTLMVVHGHGTGALRKVVHEILSNSPYVNAFRAASQHEGGDGTTVIQLRD